MKGDAKKQASLAAKLSAKLAEGVLMPKGRRGFGNVIPIVLTIFIAVILIGILLLVNGLIAGKMSDTFGSGNTLNATVANQRNANLLNDVSPIFVMVLVGGGIIAVVVSAFVVGKMIRG